MDSQDTGFDLIFGTRCRLNHLAILIPNSAARYNGPRAFWVKYTQNP